MNRLVSCALLVAGCQSADIGPEPQPKSGVEPLASPSAPPTSDAMLPELTHRDAAAWINSPPLSVADLRGSVVLVDVWTFACWNCYRSFPWLHALESRHVGTLRVLGVHAPELESERGRERVLAKVTEHGLTHPVMIDEDHSYWRALGNEAWPAFYVVDKRGRIRGRFVGETHEGDAQARAIEALVIQLAAEPAT